MLSVKIDLKKFDDKTIIKNLNLEFEDNKFTSLIGPSGCGKSTLLQIISNLDREYLGHININDKKIEEIDIGFMFQDSRLIPWLTVLENLLLISKDQKEENIIQDLSQLGLKEYINSYAKELSGGMKRKVSLLRTFLNKPQLILLDEAFISLDYPTAQSLRSDFLKLYKEYKPTVIFVTHNLKEAISMSNRIIFLDKNPMNVIHDYENIYDFSLNLEDNKIEELKKELLAKHPQLLSGEISF